MRIYASCSGHRGVMQGNLNILQHLQSDHRPGASIKLFLNRQIKFYLNDMTVDFAKYDIVCRKWVDAHVQKYAPLHCFHQCL